MGGIPQRERTFERFGEDQTQAISFVDRGRNTTMISPSDEVPQFAGEKRINANIHDFRELPRCEFGVDLSEHSVLAARLEKAREDKRRDAFPLSTASGRPQQMFDVTTERRQLPEHCQVARSDHGDLKVADTPFGPRSSESANRTLCDISQAHLGVDDDVVEAAIAVQVHGESVGVLVVVPKRFPLLIFAS